MSIYHHTTGHLTVKLNGAKKASLTQKYIPLSWCLNKYGANQFSPQCKSSKHQVSSKPFLCHSLLPKTQILEHSHEYHNFLYKQQNLITIYVHFATTHSISKETMMLQCLLTNFTAVFETPAKTENQVKKSMVQSIKGLVLSI
jgi:hypothetical protein